MGFMCLFCIVMILLLYLFQVVFLEQFYKTVKYNEIKTSTTVIEKNLDNDELETLMARISQENDICIGLYTSEGKKIAESHILRDCVIHNMPGDVLFRYYDKAVGEGGRSVSVMPRHGFSNGLYNPSKFEGDVPEPDGGLGESIIVTSVKYSEKYGSDMVIFLNTTTAPVTATKNTLQTELVIIVLILLIVAVVLSFIMARFISAPITKMSYEAKKLARGSYDVGFSGKEYKESSELADSLNFAAEELSKTDRLQKELIANISHDLRTPLTMISGCAEMMQDIPGEMTKENLQVIIDESKRLSSLVNDVMDLSKLGAKIGEITKSKFNLTSTVEATIDRINRMSAADGYDIDFICDSEAIVYADETRILQVVYNLLINAINHTGEDRRVTVKQTVSPEHSFVRIEVTDTGSGIAKEDLPYIWDRYYKVDKVHKRGSMGTGLGLSIVRSILELHGAKYGVDSQEGEGTTFWFELM